MLALVGSGEYLPPIASMDRELIGRLAAPVRVVCLPTAAGSEGHARVDYWSRLGVDHFTGLGAQVQSLPVIDRPSADDPALAAEVAHEMCIRDRIWYRFETGLFCFSWPIPAVGLAA